MPSRVVKQPNGLLGYFSTIVDDFTYINMSRDEMIEVCRGHMGNQEAVDKVDRGIADAMRWKDSLTTIVVVHGAKVARERKLECSTLVQNEPEEA